MRVGVEEILEAYRKCGALPLRGAYRAPGFELCPLAALAYARDLWAPSVDDDDDGEGAQVFGRMLADCLGLDPDYMHGFTMGFDLAHERREDVPEGPLGTPYNDGWQDGAKVAEAVFARLWGRKPKRRKWEPAPERKPLPVAAPLSGDDDIPF